MPLCKDFEEKLIKHVWRTRKVARRSTFIPPSTAASTTAPSISGSQADLNPTATTNTPVELNEKVNPEDPASAVEQKKPPAKRSWWSWRLQPATPQSTGDPEKGAERKKPRKLILLGPLYAGCGAALAMCTSLIFSLPNQSNFGTCYLDFVTAGVSVLLQEYALDGTTVRFALLVTMPIIFCVSLVCISHHFC
jgi:hypothetical protein